MNDLRRRRQTRINITTRDSKEEEKKKDDSTTAPILVLEGPVLSIEKQKVVAIPSFAGKKYQGQNIVTYVKAIDFTLNRLTDIKKVEEFRRLLSLTLDHNELTARSFEDVKLRRLENLSVAHNNIQHLENFIGNLIKGFPAIRQLNLQGNPCVPNKYVNPKQYQNYRYYVICKLPKLRVLDGQPVTPVELKRIQGKQIEPPLQLLEEQFVSPLEKDDLGFSSVKEGNLTIMKNKVILKQEWDPKWFVLGERRLLYYTDEESSRNLNKPLKVIPLGGYQFQIGPKHVASRGEYWIFSLVNSSKGKSYHFLVEDKNDLEDWKFCFKLQLVENVESVRNQAETPVVVISTEEEDLDSKQWDSIEDYQKAITQRELQIAHKRIEKLASFSLDAKDIELGEILGRGSFGVVHKGICRGKPVAVKKLHTQDLNPDALKDFANEIEIMTKIHHPHIILCMGACIEPGKLMIVTELMNTDLEQLITDQQRQLNLTTRLRMAKDAALGINWLHCSEPMIIHRDVKPSNFLIDENLRVVVADFGLSEGIKKGASKWDPQGSFKGSLLFTSPEILKGAEFDEKSDVYSFGIVLWVLYTRELDPYPELAAITNQEYADKMIYEKYRPKIDDKCPPGLKKLMEDCWAPLQKDRPSFEHIIQRLESLILELSISDLESREFWRKYYQDKEKVRWSDFSSKVEGLLGAPLEDKRDLSMLQAIFCECSNWIGLL